MTKFIDLTLNGISTGAVYAAVALALVLIWRATRISWKAASRSPLTLRTEPKELWHSLDWGAN